MDGWTILGAWVAVALTLGLYTFLYKDNPVFKLCEHIYLGAGMGWVLVTVFFTVVQPKLMEPLWYRFQADVLQRDMRPTATMTEDEAQSLAETGKQATWFLLIPAFLSLAMLLRFVPKAAWMSRWAFAFIVGYYAGLNIPAVISADIFSQVRVSLMPLITKADPWWKGINFDGICILVGVLSVLVYFFFSVEHKGPVRVLARFGVIYLMISFGAAFGYTVMARESLLIGRVQELIGYSNVEYYYATPILLPLIVMILILMEIWKDPSGSGEPSAREA